MVVLKNNATNSMNHKSWRYITRKLKCNFTELQNQKQVEAAKNYTRPG